MGGQVAVEGEMHLGVLDPQQPERRVICIPGGETDDVSHPAETLLPTLIRRFGGAHDDREIAGHLD